MSEAMSETLRNLPTEWQLLHALIGGLWPSGGWPEISTYLAHEEAEKRGVDTAAIGEALHQLARTEKWPPPPLALIEFAKKIAEDWEREERQKLPAPTGKGFGGVPPNHTDGIDTTWRDWRVHAYGSIIKDHHAPHQLRKACEICLPVYEAMIREMPRDMYLERRAQSCEVGVKLLDDWHRAVDSSKRAAEAMTHV